MIISIKTIGCVQKNEAKQNQKESLTTLVTESRLMEAIRGSKFLMEHVFIY